MNNSFLTRISWLWLFAVNACVSLANAASDAATPWQLPPGWTKTRGGCDGRTIAVTTLAAHGPGSLAAALESEGPRTIVFEVGWSTDENLSASGPRLMALPQTSGDAIPRTELRSITASSARRCTSRRNRCRTLERQPDSRQHERNTPYAAGFSRRVLRYV